MQRLLGVILAFMLGSTGACAAGRARVVTRSDFKVGAQPIIIVDSDRGNVALASGPAGSVIVEAERQAASDEAARKLDVTAALAGGTVRVQFRASARGGANDQVELRITAPADARLQVRTGAGNVEARGFAGTVQLESRAGNLKVEDLSGSAKLRADAGTLTAHRIDGAIDAESGGGDMHVDGALRGGSRLATGGGAVHVALPANSRLVVSAYSGAGAVRNDFGLPVACASGPCSWRGTLGDGGGGRLDLRTGGGSIVIAKASDGAASAGR